MRRAGFWLRAVALGIDWAVAGTLAWVLGLAPFYYFAERGRPELGQYLLDVVSIIVLLGYTSTEVWAARTPGKMLLGLRIMYPDGTPADRWTLLLRWSTKFAAYLIGLVSAIVLQPVELAFLAGWMNGVILVGCVQALDEDKRTWHDRWARTAVFRRHRRPPPLQALPGNAPVVSSAARG